MYKLRPPDDIGNIDVRVRKGTRILGVLEHLDSINVLCDRNHDHIAALGSVRIGGRRIARSAAAGAYPHALCRAIAELVAAVVRP